MTRPRSAGPVRTAALRALPVAGAVGLGAVLLLLLVLPAVRAAPEGSFPETGAAAEIGGEDRIPRIVDPDLSADGRRIAFEVPGRAGGSGEVWIARADESLGHRAVACAARPCLRIAQPAFSPDGEQLVVVQTDASAGSRGRSHLLVVDLLTGIRRTIASTADDASAYTSPRWTPDGRGVEVRRTGAGGSAVVEMIPVPSSSGAPSTRR